MSLPSSGASERCFTQEGSTLPANIRLGRKGLSGADNLVYYEHSLITDEKSFIKLALRVKIIQIMELQMSSFTEGTTECL